MNATCKQCDTIFRIDPAKLAAERVRVRCSICRGIFEVQGPDGQAEGAPEAAGSAPEPERRVETPPVEEQPEAAEPGERESPTPGTGTVPEDVAGLTDLRSPERRPPETPRAASTGSGAGAATPEMGRGTSSRTGSTPAFGSRDPDARARRLARALVSDIATYHPTRRDEALREGTLKEDFRDEIRKSWQEYVDQVGLQTARGTPHFRDALNDILAKGNRIF